ncbi:MAG TPA: sulfur oxidation c-type cytochrome SoxA [Hyphomicrobiaceae bacterium]|nr:sulfur oxidation c-type cytochrome SoxA [Hyphomicrobiaceae bacterium]
MLRAAALTAAFCLVAGLPVSGEISLSERRSTYQDMSAETRAMQDVDTGNPGMLWVLDGEALWRAKAGKAAVACAGCHGDAEQSMKGVAARYPAYDAKRETALDLAGRINICRTERQQAPELARESRELLALTALIARQSRGLPIKSDDARLKPFIETGRTIFNSRQGQLDLACAQCHDDNWGGKLAGITLPQGHPTGYPLYRLEWQTLGSLQRRLRNCMIGMRAKPYAYGSPELIALEAYLKWRARGMAMESPAVRP